MTTTTAAASDIIQLDLPYSPKALPLMGASLRAMLQRIEGVEQTADLGDAIVATVEESLAPYLNNVTPTTSDRVTAALTFDPRSHRLFIDFGDVWQHEFELSDPPDQLIVETTSGDAGLGMGLYLVRQLMDDVEYTPESGSNRWQLRKNLPVGVQTEAEQITLELPASYKYLNVLGELIEAFLASLNLPAENGFLYDVQLALHETSTNIVDHAYAGASGRFSITLALDPSAGQLTARTLDTGSGTFNLAAVPDPFELAPSPRGSLLSGSVLLFASATIVNAGNYLFNLILGRWLGPSQFADLSLIVTLLLMIGFVVVGVQQTSARFAAMFSAAGEAARLASMRFWMRRWALIAGLVLMLLFGLGAPIWQEFFHTVSFWPFVILAVGLPFYLMQGVDRGVLQGQTRFKLLSGSYQIEMWVRLLGAVALVSLGWGVNGAVGAISMSLVAAWLLGMQAGKGLSRGGTLSAEDRRVIRLFAAPVIVSEISQILINNSDILIVKHFFPSEAAGHYAALALIGRMVFYATWSVVVVMFPIVAQRQQRGEAHRGLLAISLGLVSVVSVVIIAATLLFPELIVNILFGEAYLVIAPLLWLYAIATAFYALANVVVNYRLSLGSGAGASFALFAGVAQVLGLWFFHANLRQVVIVQIVIMAVLLVSLLIWDQTQQRAEANKQAGAVS